MPPRSYERLFSPNYLIEESLFLRCRAKLNYLNYNISLGVYGSSKACKYFMSIQPHNIMYFGMTGTEDRPIQTFTVRWI